MLGTRTLGEAPLGADADATSAVSGTLALLDAADSWDISSHPGTIAWSDAADSWAVSGAGAVVGSMALADARDTWSIGGDATTGPSTDVLIVKISPFFVTDTIVTPGYQLYRYVAGVQTADGAHMTTGIDAIPDVPNQYSVGLTSDQMTLDDDGGYRGIIVWDSGGGVPADPVADEVYVHAAVVESSGGGDGATWDEVIEGSYTAKDLLRILVAVAAGKTDIVRLGRNHGMVTFRNVTDTADMVEAEMQSSERVVVTITP